ncbi:MAG TPA: ribonucleotide-diphosphate reductase subunit alpha, partial [Leuconostoc mesenteroides]|nr:ribonucleotide-diphosphate reductase subunit alpha [Leuconostoc mesenteroides]
MSLKELDLENVTYFDLNNQVNIPKNNEIQLDKDQEALNAFLDENVLPNVMHFDSLQERLDWMFDHRFLEREFIQKYNLTFIEKLYTYLAGEHF